MTQNECAYYQLFEALVALEADMERGLMHFRNRAGRLLTTVDEVVQAILNDDLKGDTNTETTGNDSSQEAAR